MCAVGDAALAGGVEAKLGCCVNRADVRGPARGIFVRVGLWETTLKSSWHVEFQTMFVLV